MKNRKKHTFTDSKELKRERKPKFDWQVQMCWIKCRQFSSLKAKTSNEEKLSLFAEQKLLDWQIGWDK